MTQHLYAVATILIGGWIAVVAIDAQTRAELAGTWQLDLDPDFGGNQDSVTCTISTDSGDLVLRCGGAPSVVHVDGTRVTFDVKTGRNDELTASFSGTLERGPTIRGTWRLDNREGKFVLRKQ